MSIAFKEWTLVCDALGQGAQSIILRKGGIAEGRAGFRFQHEEFYLFPTLFHGQVSKLKLPVKTLLPEGNPNEIQINFFARVEWTARITDLNVAQRLAPFHIWRDEVIEERFHYDGKDELHLAFLRIYRLQTPWTFPSAPRYGGCRSWVELAEETENFSMQQVLSAEESVFRSEKLRELAVPV